MVFIGLFVLMLVSLSVKKYFHTKYAKDVERKIKRGGMLNEEQGPDFNDFVESFKLTFPYFKRRLSLEDSSKKIKLGKRTEMAKLFYLVSFILLFGYVGYLLLKQNETLFGL
jgi:hypothetical protein